MERVATVGKEQASTAHEEAAVIRRAEVNLARDPWEEAVEGRNGKAGARSPPQDDNRLVPRRENGGGRMVQMPQAKKSVSSVSRHIMPRGQRRPSTGRKPHGKGYYLQERTQSTPPKSSHQHQTERNTNQRNSTCCYAAPQLLRRRAAVACSTTGNAMQHRLCCQIRLGPKSYRHA